MKWISFAYTTPALLAGAKTTTYREWSDDYAARFKRGELVKAYDKRPQWGGKRIATIRIKSVKKIAHRDIPIDDYEREGFAWMCENQDKLNKAGIRLVNMYPNKETFHQACKAMGDEKIWRIEFEVVLRL